jgi:AcrR family transcriptional regulator
MKNEKPAVKVIPADDGTRERIVLTAMRLYATGGLEQVSMRAIGTALSVSQMAAYRHFKSKDELFAEILRRVFDGFAGYLERAVDSGSTPAARLVRYTYAYVNFGRQAPADYKFIFDLWPREQYQMIVRKEGSGVLARSRAFNVQLRVVADMMDADPASALVQEKAHIMWQSLHGLVSLHTAKKLGFGMTLDDLIKPTLSVLVKGLFPTYLNP